MSKFSISLLICILLLSGCALNTKFLDSSDSKIKFSKTDDIKTIDLYTKIIKNDPNNKNAWHKLSLIYYYRKMFADAIKSASSGIKLMNDNNENDNEMKLELQAVTLVSSLKIGSKIIQDMNINQSNKDFNTRTEAENMVRVLQKALNDNIEIFPKKDDIAPNTPLKEDVIKIDDKNKNRKNKSFNKPIEKISNPPPNSKSIKIPTIFDI